MDKLTKHWYVADPVHQFVEFGGYQPVVKAIVGTRVFQRLRHISQLGLASYVFPGAVHSRFSHSLGAAHLAARLVEQLKIEEREARTVVCAALLHDVGHGPFSHSFERALERVVPDRPTHEDWTRAIVLNQLAPILGDHGVDAHRVCALIHRESEDQPVPTYLRQIISSQLDVDRMDYLGRDAHFAGVPIGRIDLPYLLRNVRVIDHGSQQTLGLSAKGVHSYEAFAFARHVMNKSVYFHKQVATFECMMEECIRLLVESVGSSYRPELIQALRQAKTAKPEDIGSILSESYLKVTEDQLWTAVTAAADRGDQLGRLSTMLLDRIPVPSLRVADHKHKVLSEELRREKFEPHHCCVRTLPSGVYKQDTGEQVFVSGERNEAPDHISRRSPLVAAFHDQTETEAVLVIFDEAIKERVIEVARRAYCLETSARNSSRPLAKGRQDDPAVQAVSKSSA